MVFKKGPKTPKGSDGKPSTGAQPEGGYGSYGTPSRAQKMSTKRGDCLRMKSAALKPNGGYGTHGKPNPKKPKLNQAMGGYAADGMAEPKSPVPSDQATGRFNLPRGKFV